MQMPIPVTKTTEFEQILKTMTGLGFSPYNEKGIEVRDRIIACPDPDQQALLTTVFCAVKEAFDMAECVDNVREAIKRTETHYHVIAGDIEDHFKLLQKCIKMLNFFWTDYFVQLTPEIGLEMNGILGEWARLRSENNLLKVEEPEITSETKG